MVKLPKNAKILLGVVRILAWLDLLVFGLMKLGADNAMKEMVGGAGHALGLTFLPITTWFWIAVVGEILAWLMLVCGKRAKYGAILALIIMVFAINAKWVDAQAIDPNAIFVALVSLAVLVFGSGYYIFNKGKFQKEGTCCHTGNEPCCGSSKNVCPKCGNDPCTCEMA